MSNFFVPWSRQPTPATMTEDFLYYLYQYHLPGKPLSTTGDEPLTVFQPGTRNHHSGPDFFNGKIKIGNTLWAGNIEIHVRSSDWFRHGHHNDPRYENIIPHVVYTDDRPVLRPDGRPVATLELKGKFNEKLFETYRGFLLSKQWIPCEAHLTRAGHFHLLNILHRMAAERLEQKASALEQQLRQNNNDFRETFYQKLLENYGFKANAVPFARLARSLPYVLLAKHKDNLFQIEALLFGQAGLLSTNVDEEYPRQLLKEYDFLSRKYGLEPLPPTIWRFMRLRPPNFPTVRLAQFATLFYRSTALLHKILETRRLSDVVFLLHTEASAYWNTHYRFGKPAPPRVKKMGKSSIHLILINTIIPFLFVYGNQSHRQDLRDKALEWLTKLPPERNTITQHFSTLGVKPENALHSQALLHLKHNYCDRKQCLSCGIGHQLLKSV